jgi:ectoine hydroxylase-related dioxygenase (phytanoyl-CoA dioxygenase family)
MVTTTLPEVVASKPGQALTADEMAAVTENFYRDGYAIIRNALPAELLESLIPKADAVFDDPKMSETHNRYGDLVCVRMFETHNAFRDLLVQEPLIGMAEEVLGGNCHIMAQNCVRNRPGMAIDSWHVDDCVEFPLTKEFARHDARMRMPVFRMTVQIPLTPIQTMEIGPTQFVPTSHYAGRQPVLEKGQEPEFDGQGPVSIFTNVGDVYLHNGQAWHRGAPNLSNETRYLLQNSYSSRWVAQRFYPFLNYRMPDHVLVGADERMRRVLGEHPKGPYG